MSAEGSNRDTEILDESKTSLLLSILKQIKLGSEIKHIRLPSFLLEPRSTLEAMADMFAHQHLILDLPNTPNPEERFFNVIRFYLSGLQARPQGVKKPFNPIIGEQHACEWELPDQTRSFFQAEQISHHPPHTAFSMYNDSKGVYVACNMMPSYVKFLGNSAETHMQGSMVIAVHQPINRSDFVGTQIQTYEATFPSLCVKGILLGRLHMQTVGKATLVCPQTGYSCKFDFKSKGLLSSGKGNAMKAKIYYKDKHFYNITGHWDDQLFISPASKGEELPFYNVMKCPSGTAFKVEVPQEKRSPMDSKFVWATVAAGIHNRNDQETFAAKDAIEERQRHEEAERVKAGIPWVPAHFVLSNYGGMRDFWVQERLSGMPPFVSGGPAIN